MKKIILVLITITQCSVIFAQEVGDEDRRGVITVFESNTTRGNRAILHADEKGAYLKSTWNTQGTDAISFRNSDNEVEMIIDKNGSVGIGTETPLAKLQISSSDYGISQGLRLHDKGGGSNEGLWIQFSQAYMSDMARIGARSVDNDRGSLKFYTKDTNDGESKERMIINPDGSVKIGGNYVSSLLRLEATDESGAPARAVGIELHGYEGRGKGMYISDKNTTHKWFVGEGYDYNGIGIGYSSGTQTEYSANTKFFVSTDGNVGIGTLNNTDATGTYKLSVKGKVRAEEVKVYTDWADFVFDKDYNLPTLKEVENHITTKGHLKGIPSAKEVEKNGIYLGEINSKLLQKIEELTLYTIQQEKRINSLEESNYELKEQNKKLKKNSEEILLIKKEIESLKINK